MAWVSGRCEFPASQLVNCRTKPSTMCAASTWRRVTTADSQPNGAGRRLVEGLAGRGAYFDHSCVITAHLLSKLLHLLPVLARVQ